MILFDLYFLHVDFFVYSARIETRFKNINPPLFTKYYLKLKQLSFLYYLIFVLLSFSAFDNYVRKTSHVPYWLVHTWQYLANCLTNGSSLMGRWNLDRTSQIMDRAMDGMRKVLITYRYAVNKGLELPKRCSQSL